MWVFLVLVVFSALSTKEDEYNSSSKAEFSQKVSVLTAKDIKSNLRNMTDLQQDSFFKSLRHTRIRWTAKVSDADKNIKGCYVTATPSEVGFLFKVHVYMSCEDTQSFKKFDLISYEGDITYASTVLGTTYVSVKAATITQL